MARHETSRRRAGRSPSIGGTGALGFGLALRWAVAGVPVMIGSRDAGRAAEAAGKVRERARERGAEEVPVEGLDNEEAAKRARTVVLAVPFRAQSENLNNLRNALEPQTVLVDATVPLAAAIGGRATRTLGVWQGSAAQQAAEMAPRGVTVCPRFTPSAPAALADPGARDGRGRADRRRRPQGQGRRRGAGARIPGLRPVDCGDLELARIIEQLTPLLISVNKRHKVKHSGIRITGLDRRTAS